MLHLREVRQTVQRPAFLGCAGVYRSVLYAQALGIRLAICIVFFVSLRWLRSTTGKVK